ncbi:hypothetical protein A3742_10635 [Oleiphilus sp. HI0071]|nr:MULTISPECIES: heme ABC exporter ATP-binding protein CcmA [unclassified Oleiphilus]KZY61245.1 hypothetical protein A3737_15380 [Oleiphilus sp. HI0065]KZY81902.1 hypothetical protein A3742_10635 [Oleiphilus sp. HI0071]KZY91674.1 hypothetical protein A3744_15035 [Oleiphilus sp. HI0073]KZZ42760.1 hypothetical protein A3758_20885 [Oleiphilus sp. HI0118]KZZ61867.1 hypothetical protein A3760_00220 [Oleiphilus sp. HI0122]KZZ65710.1 hypothetical protein A3765_05665 [Oleiphilus sp. HI0130]KZZ78225.
MSESLIQVSELHCERDDRVLFEGLSFNLCAGELVHVKGVNGAGKSTLLRCLAGLYSGYSGTIERSQMARSTKYFGHKINVKRNLTASENLEMYSLFCEARQIDNLGALAEVGLAGYEHVLCSDMSEGQRRRVALASILTSGSKVCLLDEPFASLDRLGVEFLEQFLISLVEKGSLVVFTSHHQFDDERLRSLVLGSGYE